MDEIVLSPDGSHSSIDSPGTSGSSSTDSVVDCSSVSTASIITRHGSASNSEDGCVQGPRVGSVFNSRPFYSPLSSTRLTSGNRKRRTDRPVHGKLYNYTQRRTDDIIQKVFQAVPLQPEQDYNEHPYNKHHFGKPITLEHKEAIKDIFSNVFVMDVGGFVVETIHHYAISKRLRTENDYRGFVEQGMLAGIGILRSKTNSKLISHLSHCIVFGQDLSRITKRPRKPNIEPDPIVYPVDQVDRNSWAKALSTSVSHLLSTYAGYASKLKNNSRDPTESSVQFVRDVVNLIEQYKEKRFINGPIFQEILKSVNKRQLVYEHSSDSLARPRVSGPVVNVTRDEPSFDDTAMDEPPFDDTIVNVDENIAEPVLDSDDESIDRSIEEFHSSLVRETSFGSVSSDPEVQEEISIVTRDKDILDHSEEDELIGLAETSIRPLSDHSLLVQFQQLKSEHYHATSILQLVGDGLMSLSTGEKLVDLFKGDPRTDHLLSLKAITYRMKAILQRTTVKDVNGFNLEGANCREIIACKYGCMAFTGEFEHIVSCIVCSAQKNEGKKIMYLSPREMIRAQFGDKEVAKAMLRNKKRADIEKDYGKDDTEITDVWDSEGIRKLKTKPIRSKHSKYGFISDGNKKYFEDDYELSFTLAADGVNPWSFKSDEYITICLINNNLDATYRQQREYVHIPMVYHKVPEKKAKGRVLHDTFLQPLIDDFAEMGAGFSVYDASTKEVVTVKAHLTHVTGDIPAVAHLMAMKGHNSILPCRTCDATRSVVTYRGDDGKEHRPGGVLFDRSSTLRSHDEFVKAQKDYERLVKNPTSNSERLKQLERDHGIKGYSVLFQLGSLEMPWSFVPDAMHMIHVNICKTVFSLIREENVSHLNSAATKKLDEMMGLFNTALSSRMGGGDFPTTFFRQGLKGNTKAVTWKRIIELFPILAQEIVREIDSFTSAEYPLGTPLRKDFICFILEFTEILVDITEFGITVGELRKLSTAIDRFLKQYHLLVYDKTKPATLAYFTLPIHMLSHVCDYIKYSGMPRYMWCYTMERSCRTVKLIAGACRYPLTAINNKLVLVFYNNVMAPARRKADLRVRDSEVKHSKLVPMRNSPLPLHDDDLLDKVNDAIRKVRGNTLSGTRKSKYVWEKKVQRDTQFYTSMTYNGTTYNVGDIVQLMTKSATNASEYHVVEIRTFCLPCGLKMATGFPPEEIPNLHFVIVRMLESSENGETLYHSTLYEKPRDTRSRRMVQNTKYQRRFYDIKDTIYVYKPKQLVSKLERISPPNSHDFILVHPNRASGKRLTYQGDDKGE